MLLKSDASHHYSSAHKRFLKPCIMRFFETELPRTFGPEVRSLIADKLIEIFYSNNVDIKSLQAGQVLWNAVHKETRADAPNMKTVPVILTLVNDDDISQLENGLPMPKHRRRVIARILNEAYQQGALLSMRDIGILIATNPSVISAARIEYEKENNITLPHTGNLHDMGTTLTHKYQIVYKHWVEHKDPKTISKETKHSVKAVDRYLNDFNRVKTLYLDGKDLEFIKTVTNISINVSTQYVEMIEQYVKERK